MLTTVDNINWSIFMLQLPAFQRVRTMEFAEMVNVTVLNNMKGNPVKYVSEAF